MSPGFLNALPPSATFFCTHSFVIYFPNLSCNGHLSVSSTMARFIQTLSSWLKFHDFTPQLNSCGTEIFLLQPQGSPSASRPASPAMEAWVNRPVYTDSCSPPSLPSHAINSASGTLRQKPRCTDCHGCQLLRQPMITLGKQPFTSPAHITIPFVFF